MAGSAGAQQQAVALEGFVKLINHLVFVGLDKKM
jgi:hypothetical protein